jgi:hypothetical protein
MVYTNVKVIWLKTVSFEQTFSVLRKENIRIGARSGN